MRMRKKPNLGVRMERCTRVLISDPEERKGKWRELMPEAKEVFLELGCGKGRYEKLLGSKIHSSLCVRL